MVAIGDPAWIAISATALGIGLLILIGIIVWRRPTAGLKAELGALKVTLTAVEQTAQAVHDAINDRPAGAPTISQQVATMAARVDTIDAKLSTLTTELAAHILANPGLPEHATSNGPPRPRYGA